MKRNARPIRSILATAIGIAWSLAATASLADAPQAVTIETDLVFNPGSTVGTFVATGPICPTGTVNSLTEAVGEGPAAFNVNAFVTTLGAPID